MSSRIESDSMGDVEVAEGRYWGAQTQRSLQNFRIGGHRFGRPVIGAFGVVKNGGRPCESRPRQARSQARRADRGGGRQGGGG